MDSWIPKEWALEIISEEEYNMLIDLIKFDADDVAMVKKALDDGTVPDEYLRYALQAAETGMPVYTNNLVVQGLSNDALDDEDVAERYSDIFDHITKFDIHAIERINVTEDDVNASQD